MDTEMVKIVTDRLSSQSLDDITNINDNKVEDRDSGTESDEELLAITEGMSGDRQANSPTSTPAAAAMMCPQPVLCSTSPSFRDAVRRAAAEEAASSVAGLLSGQRRTSPPSSSFSSSLSQAQALQPQFHFQRASILRHPESPQECSDYERCSLDFEPSNSSTDAESSVDYELRGRSDDYDLELVELNTNCESRQQAGLALNGFHPLDTLEKISDSDNELAELDMLSDVDTPPMEETSPPRCGSCGSSVSATSDDEVRELLGKPRPLRFRASPPRGVHKLNKRTISPKVFLASVHASYSMLPRKRYRYSNTNMIQRPHLDFEKMQVTRSRILYSVM